MTKQKPPLGLVCQGLVSVNPGRKGSGCFVTYSTILSPLLIFFCLLSVFHQFSLIFVMLSIMMVGECLLIFAYLAHTLATKHMRRRGV